MKLMRSRVITYIALSIVLISFIGMIVTMIVHNNHRQSNKSFKTTVSGMYSADGGEWQDTIPDDMLHRDFDTVTIKGTLTNPVKSDSDCLIITADNIWYELRTEKGVFSNYRKDDDSALKDTPGSNIDSYKRSELFADSDNNQSLTLTLTFPYPMQSSADLSDYFNMYTCDADGIYELMLERRLPAIIFDLTVCFFGLFAFPIAASVLGGINNRYLAFSLLCFFTGIYLLSRALYTYLPIWIDDSVICMSLCESTRHLFEICVLIFVKVILNDSLHKLIGNICMLLFTLFIVTLIVFNFTGISDLFASAPYAQALFFVIAVILAICIAREWSYNDSAQLAVFTLIPLAIVLAFDTINVYIGFSDIRLFEFGAAVTLVYQTVNLLIDLRRQYREALRSQQLQRELYESRVSIMVSQIQPHFLYNSLSSIAMLCTLDPETAQEATITFADYLRGNMDSLKQKEPVPFSKELEHLKKYLYIEKLRFGKKLNIEYDIQTEDFVLPQLSIQPLAENAVKHGISKKRGGGTLTISTRETDTAYHVIVSDDGKGFDPDEVKDDGRSHVGMENVKRRLKEMCDGEVTVKSKIGEETVATVTLPKEGQHHENPVC